MSIMATPVVQQQPPSRRQQLPQQHPNGTNTMMMNRDELNRFKARIFLAAACLWPLVIMALFASSSSSNVDDPNPRHHHHGHHSNLTHQHGTIVRDVLDRVDIMGYGPTHPRMAAVIVSSSTGGGATNGATDADRAAAASAALIATTESVFRTTDMARIFVVVIVVDGMSRDKDLVRELEKIHRGAIPHWHGLRPDLHNGNGQDQEEQGSAGGGEGESTSKHHDSSHHNNNYEHDAKVHVMFNKKARGVASCRADGVEFVRLLSDYHESAGLKSEAEDLILVLLQAGAQLQSRRWLPQVTQALIVPPPLLGGGHDAESDTVSLKLANAVSFQSEGAGKRTGVDMTFGQTIGEPTADEMNENNGASYPSPALNGAAIALRLDTYLNLPAQDLSLRDAWHANVDLALNLWLCADGIDILQSVQVTVLAENGVDNNSPMLPSTAARFAAAWMDPVTANQFYRLYSTKYYPELTHLEWETSMAEARQASPTFPHHLPRKCRSLQWYAQHVNPDWSPLIQQQQSGDNEKEEDTADEKGRERRAEMIENMNLNAEEKRAILKKLYPDQVAKLEQEDKQQQQRHQPQEEDFKNPPPRVPAGLKDEEVVREEVEVTRKKPAVPLCAECLEIIQKAKAIDVSYVDVAGGHAEHPHLGARDVDGELGYVHDATALRRDPPAFELDPEVLSRGCTNRDNNYKMIHEKVFVDLEAHQRAEEAATSSNKPRTKIFCLVYTISGGHHLIPNIRQTWGPKCDGFMVGSNATDPDIGAVDIPHEGPEEYNNIWQKVRSMWSYIYDHYYNDYDWFHIGGDDLFLIVENLRLYLESEEIRTAQNGGIYLPAGGGETERHQVPMFMGRRFAYQGNLADVFNSGGAGYTLNKAALKLLVVEGFPKYFPHLKTFSEDTMVARIFRKFGVVPYETKDAAGGERYMPFMPGHHYGYRLPEDKKQDWYATYSINIKEGADHCAARAVAFHYVKGTFMKRLYTLLYHLCPKEDEAR